MASLFNSLEQLTKRRQPISDRYKPETRREQFSSVSVRKPVVVTLSILNRRLSTKNDVHQNIKNLARHYKFEKAENIIRPLRSNMYKTNAPSDTKAVRSSISEAELQKLTTAQTSTLLRDVLAANFKIQIANGNVVKVTK